MILKRMISLGLALSVAFIALQGTGVAKADASRDYEGHWAQEQIESWLQQGFLKGFEDGSVKPDEAITRAEFVTLVNRMWAITESKPVKFSDVPETSWAYAEFSKAMSVGYIQGYEGKVRPDGLITRQEAAVIISRLMHFEDPPTEGLSVFTDYNQMADWSKPKIAAMVNIDAMEGYPDGSFRPDQPMTRAESITLMNSFNHMSCGIGDIEINSPGEVGGCSPSDVKTFNNVTVNASGVVLKNMIILGDLLLEKGAGEGEITLNNVTVEGMLIVQGSGMNKVQLTDSRLGRIVVQKKSGEAHLIAGGTTDTGLVLVRSGVRLEEIPVSGKGFTDIEAAEELQAGIAVLLDGSFDNMTVKPAGMLLKLQKGSVGMLHVTEGASAFRAELGAESVVTRVLLDAAAVFTGTGTVQSATVNDGGKGSSFARKPLELDGSEKNSVITGIL